MTQDTEAQAPDINPEVSRARRSYFMFLVVATTIAIPTWLTVRGYSGAMAELLAKELLGIALATILLYFGGSVLERQNVLAKLADRGKGKKEPEPEG